ncbi:hypothetical protein TNCT_67261 [Trichonephila clavata]|uniref:Uncharacterized protein n=1 Tax=Trichonephila clavata TaxID=2740835 RepID=A0A8X6G543_TRICU|nr:hypothetical protein TNCT_67261 [Trichonephila clavata]
MPKVVDRFKYSGNNVVPFQWVRKSYSRNHSKERTRLSILERLKNRRKSSRNTATSTIPSKTIYLDSEQLRAHSIFNLIPIRPHLNRSKSVPTTSAPWQVTSSPSTTGYFMLLSMSVFLMVVCCYLWKKKKKNRSLRIRSTILLYLKWKGIPPYVRSTPLSLSL